MTLNPLERLRAHSNEADDVTGLHRGTLLFPPTVWVLAAQAHDHACNNCGTGLLLTTYATVT